MNISEAQRQLSKFIELPFKLSCFYFSMKFQWRSVSYKTKLVLLCSIANFINAADRVIMPLAIVPMTAEYKWTMVQQGWILSAFAFGYFTSQVCAARS